MDIGKGVGAGFRWKALLVALVGAALLIGMAVPPAATAATTKMKKGTAVATTVYSDSSSQKSVSLKAPGKKAVWKSSKKVVASVNAKGKVTAKKPGKAVVTAKTTAGTFKCKVTVKKVSIDKKKATLSPGGTVKLKLKGEVTKSAKSSNASVATVTKKGVVTGVAEGTAKITVTGKNKKKYVCAVTVSGSSAANGNDSGGSNAGNGAGSGSGSGSDANAGNGSGAGGDSGANAGSGENPGSGTGGDSGSGTPAADGTAKVSTQAELNAALDSSAPYGQIVIETPGEVTFNIPAKGLGSTTLVIDAPKASVTNAATFKAVQVKAIAKNTYRERAKNRIEVQAVESHVVVEEGASAEVVAEPAVEDLVLENDGEIENLDVDTEGSIEITGDSAQKSIPTTVRKNAKISTATSLLIEAFAKAVLYLLPGSEGTEVNAEDAGFAPETFGLGNVKMTVTSKDGKTIINITIIIAAPDDRVSEGVVEIDKVQGKVVDSAGKPIDGARAYLVDYSDSYSVDSFKEDDARKISTESGKDGTYSFREVKAGNYNVVVVKDGYANTMQGLYLSNVEGSSYCPDTVMLTEAEKAAGKGSLSGTVVDSAKTANAGLSGMTVRVRAGQNNLTGNVLKEAKTGSDGSYNVSDLDAGVYTVEVVDERSGVTAYASTYFNVVVKGGENTAVAPVGLSAALQDGQVRFVLTWGDAAGFRSSDLDAHIVGPAGSEDEPYSHVYYGEKSYSQGGTEMSLDRDANAWDALETVTLSKASAGTFDFYVHDASMSTSASTQDLAKSGAKVAVYSGSRLLQVFSVPSDLDGTLWKVCSYNAATGALSPANVMTYEDESYEIGSDRAPGYVGLGIKEIKTNDLVTYAAFTSRSVFLATNEKLKVGVNTDEVQVTPLEAASTVEIRKSYWDDDALELVIASADGERERSYNLYEASGALRVSALLTGDVITDAVVHDDAFSFCSYADDGDSNYIEILTTKEDFDDYKEAIRPAFTPSNADWTVTNENGSPALVISANGYTRKYDIYASKDWGDFKVQSIVAKSPLVSDVRVRGDVIKVTGTVDGISARNFDDLFDVVYGKAVKSHELTSYQSERDGSTTIWLELERGDGQIRSYLVEYERNWGSLAISSIEYPSDDDAISWAWAYAGNGGSYIDISLKEVAFSEDVFKKLTFEYATTGVSGTLTQDASGYLYTISKDGLGSRVYRIIEQVEYPDDFCVNSTVGVEGTDFTRAEVYSGSSSTSWNQIYLDGKRRDFNVLKDEALELFDYGAAVAEKEIVGDADKGTCRLVLTSRSGLKREYSIEYRLDSDYDFSEAYVSIDYDNQTNSFAYTGAAIGADEVGLSVNFRGAELVRGVEYEVKYRKLDIESGSYGEATSTTPVAIGEYRMVITSKQGYDGEATCDYEIVAPNSLKLCDAWVHFPVLNDASSSAFKLTLRDADWNEVDESDYSWTIMNSAGVKVEVDAVAEAGDYLLVITPVGTAYVDSLTKSFSVLDARSIECADIEMDYEFAYTSGMELPLPVVQAASEDYGSGKLLDKSCYTLTYYKWDSGKGYVEVAEASEGEFKMEIAGVSPYYGSMTRWFSIGNSSDYRDDDDWGDTINIGSLASAGVALAA